MAINFGDTIMEGGIEPSVRVQAPVQAPAPDRSSEVFANAMAPVFGTLGQMAGTVWKNGQTDAKTKILSSYENDLLNLADFVDQGGDRNEAMIRARNLRRQYLANSPQLQDDFDTVWTDFAGANGLGNVVISGTVEQQAIEARNTEATKLGYTPQEYDVFQARARQAAALNQELDMLQANGGIVTQTQKNAATQALVGLADSAFPAAQSQINNAMAAIAADPSQKATIVEQLNLSIGQSIAQMQAITGGSDNEYIITPINGLMETFNKWANNEIENSVLEGAIKNTSLQYSTMFSSDPILGPIIAQSKLLNDLGLANTNLGVEIWSPEALKKLREVADPKTTVNLVDNTEGSARFTQNLQEIAATITPNSDPALVDEVMGAINSAVDGVYVHERSAEDGAIGFKDTVEMLGSTAIGEVIRQNGGIDAKYSEQFVGVLQDNYEAELVPAIQRYWESVPVGNPQADTSGTNNAGGISNIPMNQLLQPVWNGSAVEFVPVEGYQTNARVIALAAEVNSGSNSIGKPLNSLINAYANVGSIDPKTVWEQDFAGRLFNLGSDGKPVEPTVVDRVNEMLDGNAEPSISPQDDPDIDLGNFQPDNLKAAELGASPNRLPELSPPGSTPSVAQSGGPIPKAPSGGQLEVPNFVKPQENATDIEQSILSKYTNRRLPASIRLNNMGGISITGSESGIGNTWAANQPGFVGVVARPANEGGWYAQYATPTDGVRAASNLLIKYGENGVNTPQAIANKWAVGSTGVYAQTTTRYLKEAGYDVTVNTPLDLNDPMVRLAILKAKSAHESGAGKPIYKDDVFTRGVS